MSTVNVMIKSSLLKARPRLLQCYEITALICHTERLPSEPLFSVGTGVQKFNRQPYFCLMHWYDSELTAVGMSHRTALSEPLFSVKTGVQPLFVNCQPPSVFMRQPGLQPAIDPELYLSPTVFERSHDLTPDS